MDRRKVLIKNVVWQIVAALVAHSINIQPGINMAYSTILLPQIMGDEGESNNGTSIGSDNGGEVRSELIIKQEEASWIGEKTRVGLSGCSKDDETNTLQASLVTIATPIGSLLTGPLMDRFGRKKICIFTTIPFIVSWVLITKTTDSVYTIYSARVLAGIAGGLSTAVIVYVSEISHPSVRPMLLSLTSVFVSFGILLTLLLNYFFNWKVVAACCGAFALLSLISNLFIPESPSWIVGVRKSDEDPSKGLKKAERILKWLYKNPEDYENEYNALIKIKEQKSAARKDVLFVTDKRPKVTFKSPHAWKPLVILFVLFTLQQFSGVYLVIFYAVQIFEKSGSVEVDKFTSVVILGLIRFIMAIISMFLSKRFGRRPLLFSSGAGMAISILFAATWIYFSSEGIIPVICLLFFVFFASYGVMVIPWTLIGELLPLEIRGKGSGFMVAIVYVHMFITVKMFIAVLEYIGIVLIFTCFSVFSVLFVIFVYFKIPETLGKSFQEIENHFK